MTGTTCDMCSGQGKIIRMYDGCTIRCPKCFGSSNPAPTSRPPAEIMERKQLAHRQNKTPRNLRWTHQRDKSSGKLRRALRSLWGWIFDPLIFLWERIFATLIFLWKRILEI